MSMQGVKLSPNWKALPGTLVTNLPKGEEVGGQKERRVEGKVDEGAKARRRCEGSEGGERRKREVLGVGV